MRRATPLAVLTCCLVAAPLAFAGRSRWSPHSVGTISQAQFPHGFYGDAALTGNGRGRRLLVWAAADGLRAAVASPGHGFGRARLIRRERTPVSHPRVAMNSRGDALIVWNYFDRTHFGDYESRGGDEDCCDGARLAVLRRDGHLSRVRTLTARGVGVDVGALAIGRDGRYGLVWNEYDLYSYYYDGYYSDDPRGPGRPGLLGRFGRRSGRGRARKVDHSGHGVAMAFVHGRPRVLMWVAGRNTRLLERVAHRSGRFGARRTLARHLPPEPAIAAATNERGDEAVAWTNFHGGHRMHAGVRAPGAPLRRRTVARTEQTDPPSVAIAPSGAAAVAWSNYGRRVWLSTSPGPGVAFRDARALSKGHKGADVEEVELAIDSIGRAALAWRVWQPNEDSHVHAALVRAGGGRTRHTSFEGNGEAELPRVGAAALDDRGRATVVWRRGEQIRVAYASFGR